jgi:hypothetical protein
MASKRPRHSPRRAAVRQAQLRAIASSVASATTAVWLSASPVAQHQDTDRWIPVRCREIRTTLEHYTAGGGKLRSPDGLEVEIVTIAQVRAKRVAAEEPVRRHAERLRVARQERGNAPRPSAIEEDARTQLEAAQTILAPLVEEENRIARLINLLRDQQISLKCPGEPARAETTTRGDTTGPTTPTNTSPPVPTPTPTPGPAPTPRPDSDDPWSGVWAHGFGTITWRRAPDPEVVQALIQANNVYGPARRCDQSATHVYRGDVDWTLAGGGFDRRWRGQVYACTNGRSLEGKFSNYGAHSVMDPDFSAAFRLALSASDKERTFAGDYEIYDTRTQQLSPFPGWTGTRK